MSVSVHRRITFKLVDNERGVALPLAMLTLVILTVLSLAFLALSKTEPVIAANHARASAARALAESGLERALWALTTSVIPSSLSGVAAGPYNGSPFVTLNSRGGAFITVSSNTLSAGGQICTPTPGVTNERCVLAVGWSPTNVSGTGQPAAHRQILATVMRITDISTNAPCALCVAGELQVAGNTTIDATTDTSCGKKYATMTSGCTALGSGSCGGSPGGGSYSLKGAFDGNSTANQVTDYQQNQGTSGFPTLSTADMKSLRALAKANGTYYQGSQTFNSSNKVKNGIVFVDTLSGTDPTASTADSDLASVSINGNPFLGSGSDSSFRGWLVVNGALSISGNMTLNGLAYAANDFTYNGTGTGAINGLVISQNVKDTSATSIDTSTGGNSTITMNCDNVKGGGLVPQGWFVKSGSYFEPHD
jgi:hypothetical protein